jgi:hypothetical protein
MDFSLPYTKLGLPVREDSSALRQSVNTVPAYLRLRT